MYQKLILIGYVGKKPELRMTAAGKPFTTFSLATNKAYKQDGVLTEQVCWWRMTQKSGSFANCRKIQNWRRLKKQPEIPILCACGVIHHLRPKPKETAGEIQRPGVIAGSCPAQARTTRTFWLFSQLLNLVGKNT